MKRKILSAIFVLVMFYASFVTSVYAADDPLSRPNNFVGIHILFPSELSDAAKLVNSSGGSWGYVTIPIQSGDRDLEKWQGFMDDAKRLHIIPILRLATQPNPFDSSVWRKPNDYDIVDFANFLSSLSWPTKNKYIVLFNEVNRSDEWGGEYPNPQDYANLVSLASDVFKSRDQNFYLILSGMDDSAPNDFKKYINGFTYLEELVSYHTEDKVDGFSSHSYPNPGFSSYPSETKKIGVASYKYEYALLNQYSDKKVPVFITETGWGSKSIPDSVVSKYFTMAFSQIWDKDSDKIVAITPFILKASGGAFEAFSFLSNTGQRDFYKSIFDMHKIKGEPEIGKTASIASLNQAVTKVENFNNGNNRKTAIPNVIKSYMEKIVGLSSVIQ